MKYMIIIVVCVFLVVEVTAPPPPPPPRGTRLPPPPRGTRRPPHTHGTRRPKPPPPTRCNTAEDCEADQCCIESGPFFFRKGKCVKLSSEGKRCSPEELAINGKFIGLCPCAEGLSCEPKRTVETKHGLIRINDRCVKPGSSTVEPEDETTDSGSSESQESSESEEKAFYSFPA